MTVLVAVVVFPGVVLSVAETLIVYEPAGNFPVDQFVEQVETFAHVFNTLEPTDITMVLIPLESLAVAEMLTGLFPFRTVPFAGEVMVTVGLSVSVNEM